jgi:hypothetical protein
MADEKGKEAEGGGAKKSEMRLFQEIVGLKLGESLLFRPTAVTKVERGNMTRLLGGYVKFLTRRRITADGGKSKLADESQMYK